MKNYYYWLTAIVAIVAIVVDLISKILVINYITLPIQVIPNYFSIVYTVNKGAIFGTMQGMLPLFLLVSVIFLIIIFYSKDKLLNNKPLCIAYGLVIGGAMGNMIDRLALPPFGGVIDFLDFHLKTAGAVFSYPIFNLADMFIIIGVIILLFKFKSNDSENSLTHSQKS